MGRKRVPRRGEEALLARLEVFAGQDLRDPEGPFGYAAFLEDAIEHRHSGFETPRTADTHWRDRERFVRLLRPEWIVNLNPLLALQAVVRRVLADLEIAPAWLTISERHLE